MDTVTCLAILSVYLFLLGLTLGLCGIVADYVLPHIPFIVRYIDTLPDWEDDAETSSEMREGPNLQILQEFLRTLQHFICPTCITK